MARALLINPPWVIGEKKNLWQEVASCWPSLGLLYIAAVLEKAGHQIYYLDSSAEHFTTKETIKKVAYYKNLDYVLITVTTPLINNALKIAKGIKKNNRKVKIVLGGVHPSVMPLEVIKHKEVDYVVIDEGEETAKELLGGISEEKILGLVFKKGKKIIQNKPRPLIKDLETIPPPAYHLAPITKYYPAIGSYKRLPVMIMFATRGCPGRCTFCYRTFRGILRKRSARSILDEIKLLQKNYHIREIAFYDDTFTVYKEEIKKFCRLIREEKVDLTWSCFTRVDCVDRKLLKLMKKAGCHLILFGVESADETILQNIKKRISLKQVTAVVRTARELGIETRASFMLGNMGETEETIRKTIDFSLKLDPDEAQFNITTPYPGTEMYRWADDLGYIKTYNWDDYSISNVVLELPRLPKAKLQYYYNLAHRRFYFRPKIIFRRLSKIRSLSQLMQELKGARAIVNFLKKF